MHIPTHRFCADLPRREGWRRGEWSEENPTTLCSRSSLQLCRRCWWGGIYLPCCACIIGGGRAFLSVNLDNAHVAIVLGEVHLSRENSLALRLELQAPTQLRWGAGSHISGRAGTAHADADAEPTYSAILYSIAHTQRGRRRFTRSSFLACRPAGLDDGRAFKPACCFGAAEPCLLRLNSNTHLLHCLEQDIRVALQRRGRGPCGC